MTDRELLEAAAKAAGLRLTWGEKYRVGEDEVDCTDIPYAVSDSPDEAPAYWNPLEDDGDALRLACALRLNIAQGDFSVGVNDEAEIDDAAFVRSEDERSKVLRRAIVRAAAELAKEQK